MMTRKDYDLIAGTIRVQLAHTEQGASLATLRITASQLSRAFAQQDTKFDAEHFTTACGFG